MADNAPRIRVLGFYTKYAADKKTGERNRAIDYVEFAPAQALNPQSTTERVDFLRRPNGLPHFQREQLANHAVAHQQDEEQRNQASHDGTERFILQDIGQLVPNVSSMAGRVLASLKNFVEPVEHG